MSKHIRTIDAAEIAHPNVEEVRATSPRAEIRAFSYADFVSVSVSQPNHALISYIDMTVEQALEFAAKIGEIANAVAERESSL